MVQVAQRQGYLFRRRHRQLVARHLLENGLQPQDLSRGKRPVGLEQPMAVLWGLLLEVVAGESVGEYGTLLANEVGLAFLVRQLLPSPTAN